MAETVEATPAAEQSEKKNVYITMHKSFVKMDIQYADKKTGEIKTFNSVTLPSGTKIEGVDYGGWQFSPRFVNPSKFRGENYVDIPLLKDRTVQMHRSIINEDGEYQKDENGRYIQEKVEVKPERIKEALAASYRRYRAEQEQERIQDAPDKEAQEESLADRASSAKEASQALSGNESRQPELAR